MASRREQEGFGEVSVRNLLRQSSRSAKGCSNVYELDAIWGDHGRNAGYG
jgi:hypothetical protein